MKHVREVLNVVMDFSCSLSPDLVLLKTFFVGSNILLFVGYRWDFGLLRFRWNFFCCLIFFIYLEQKCFWLLSKVLAVGIFCCVLKKNEQNLLNLVVKLGKFSFCSMKFVVLDTHFLDTLFCGYISETTIEDHYIKSRFLQKTGFSLVIRMNLCKLEKN